MRTHRIHTKQALQPESNQSLQGHEAYYLFRVLRVKAGQVLALFNGDGFDYPARVVKTGKHEVHVEILGRLPARAESRLKITLAQAITRGERMDQTLQKATELGVVAFQPLVTERVEVRIRPEKLDQRVAHWRKVIISACEQSGRAVIPRLAEPMELADWLIHAGSAPRLVLEPDAESALVDAPVETEAELMVGPEGGLSESELVLIRRHGLTAVSLGPRILRTETAGPAAVAVLQATAGDLN